MAFNPTLRHLTTRLDGGVVWAASTEYLADNVVIFGDASYRCLVNHTSGSSFQTDLLANRWVKLSSDVINYIQNPSALVDTSGWVTYADAAAAQPVDGTGGSPSVTFSRSTTTPLRGIADFNFVKDAANRQGQGVSTDFTIDLADQAKVLTVTFDYEVLSGTYADGDLTVYLIADPNGTPVVIQPAGFTISAATVGTKMREIATFQTQASGQSYRLCLHVASTSALAYTIALDNVSVSPQVVQYGAPVTDWTQVSNVSAGTFITATTTNPTYGTIETNKAQFRRVGDSYEFHWDFKQTTAGTAGSGTYLINLPTGIVVDTSKFSTGAADFQRVIGQVYLSNATNVYEGFLNIYSSTQLYISFQDTASSATNWANTFGGFANSTLRISVNGLFPAAGLSSSVQMSNDTDTRVVAARYTTTASNTTLSGASTTLDFNTITYDTHAGGSGGSGSAKVYTIPISGFYRISASVMATTNTYTAGANRNAILQTGGSLSNIAFDLFGIQNTFTGYFTLKGTLVLYYTAGQTVSVQLSNSTGSSISLDPSNNFNYFQIERVSGPATIAANETVAASYNSSTTSFPASPSSTVIINPNKVYDTHNAYNTSTGVYKVPVSGKYRLTLFVRSALAQTNAVGSELQLRVFKNAVSQVVIGSNFFQTTSSIFSWVTGTATLALNAGDDLSVNLGSLSGAAAFTGNGNENTFFMIERIGN